MNEKKESIIDDGFNANLVKNAFFDGLLEIPIIKKEERLVIPKALVPFSKRKKTNEHSEFICFYEHDMKFRDILTATEKQVDFLRDFSGVISPDCSLYYDMPLVLQMVNTYLNRQVGHYFQSQGLYVIPNVRWGDERTYTRIIPSEIPFAFLGLEKHGIYSIGTYGCCKTTEYKHHLKEGFRSFIKEIEPEIILIYGSMPDSVFGEFKDRVQFVHYEDWTKVRHNLQGGYDGKR